MTSFSTGPGRRVNSAPGDSPTTHDSKLAEEARALPREAAAAATDRARTELEARKVEGTTIGKDSITQVSRRPGIDAATIAATGMSLAEVTIGNLSRERGLNIEETLLVRQEIQRDIMLRAGGISDEVRSRNSPACPGRAPDGEKSVRGDAGPADNPDGSPAEPSELVAERGGSGRQRHDKPLLPF